jgi:hypothetical protein
MPADRTERDETAKMTSAAPLCARRFYSVQ